MTLVIAICALVGALAGIAGSAAAPSKSKSATAARTQSFERKMFALRHQVKRGMRMGFGFGPGRGLFGPVHDEAVVPKPDGSGFITITSDSGTVNSVTGTTVDIKEGTDKVTYDPSVKVDVGSDAHVLRDGKQAALTDVQPGDHVHVITGTPKGNLVLAADDAFIAQRKKQFDEHHWGPPGPPPPGAPGDAPGGTNP